MSFKRHQDNLDFLKQFQKELADLGISDIKKLATSGQFHSLGHNIENNSHDCDGCSNCYSGDTEYEMGGGIAGKVLGEVWMKAATNLGLSTQKYPDDSSEDAEEDDDEE